MRADQTVTLARPVVRVVGDACWTAGLSQRLPASWAVRPGTGPDDAAPGELVLLVRPDPAAVAGAVDRLPAACPVVVLLEEGAPAEAVERVLAAGADACVRSGSTAVLAGHLMACHRRRLTWPGGA
ncbi:hypothetical protein [Rhizomonospora bruguierae]|uniref:hypothetical protein n=1 Tax=Rhizomonospora bruguierae TaxID=1581705 RepID=UPI001BCB676C|nr:hypothetical protein [Micromonospora sp. NBRC 107566]